MTDGAAAAYLDVNRLTRCPCSGAAIAALDIPQAIDRLQTGAVPQTVVAEPTLVAAYAAALQAQTGLGLVWSAQGDTAVLERVVPEGQGTAPLGRRSLRADLLDHLTEQAAHLLVPETEASRAAGAGAGLTDND